jgi:hypothetical protein
VLGQRGGVRRLAPGLISPGRIPLVAAGQQPGAGAEIRIGRSQ